MLSQSQAWGLWGHQYFCRRHCSTYNAPFVKPGDSLQSQIHIHFCIGFLLTFLYQMIYNIEAISIKKRDNEIGCLMKLFFFFGRKYQRMPLLTPVLFEQKGQVKLEIHLQTLCKQQFSKLAHLNNPLGFLGEKKTFLLKTRPVVRFKTVMNQKGIKRVRNVKICYFFSHEQS